MNHERALKRIESMQDEIENRIKALPPLLRDRTSLWSDLEALSIAKGCIYREMEREKEAKKIINPIIFPESP